MAREKKILIEKIDRTEKGEKKREMKRYIVEPRTISWKQNHVSYFCFFLLLKLA